MRDTNGHAKVSDFRVIVPSQFPRSGTCKIAFVGEAPSDDETIHGIPLIGPSGKVYDQLLNVAGIDRRDVYTGNVFNMQLEDNSVSDPAVTGGTKDREGFPTDYSLPPIGKRWLRPELRGQLSRLAAEIAQVRPTVIVPLGGTALWAFTGSDQINHARGATALATLTVPGIKIVPTFHPAHVLRDWSMFYTVVGDFMKAVREAEKGPKMYMRQREIWVEPTLGDMEEFKRRYLDHSEGIAVDIETKWSQITSVQFAGDSTAALVVPFTDSRRAGNSYWRTVEGEVAARQFVRRVCEMPQPKILQNGSYDQFYLRKNFKIWLRNYTKDTRLLHHALYPELPKSLEFMAACYEDAPAWKLWRGGEDAKRDD